MQVLAATAGAKAVKKKKKEKKKPNRQKLNVFSVYGERTRAGPDPKQCKTSLPAFREHFPPRALQNAPPMTTPTRALQEPQFGQKTAAVSFLRCLHFTRSMRVAAPRREPFFNTAAGKPP